MDLYRRNDSGEAVADIQTRLQAAGFACDPDSPGDFLDGTDHAVREFQRSRNLSQDGIVGRDTWRHLVEAGFRLGERYLYYRRPMMRGDDVADFQRHMNMLGFDAGKEDGIYGPNTHRALLEFQENRQIVADGVVGPLVWNELSLIGRVIGETSRVALREREWLRTKPRNMANLRIVFDPFCRSETESELAWEAAGAAMKMAREHGANPQLSRAVDVFPDESNRAQRANLLDAELVIALAVPQVEDDAGVYHFATARSHSPAGAVLAGRIAKELGVHPVGRAIPILLETRAPAVVVAVYDLGAHTAHAIIHGVEGFLAEDYERASEGLSESRSSASPEDEADAPPIL